METNDAMAMIPRDEFRWLFDIYLECLRVRSRGVREWNRLPEPIRLAVVELIAHYEAHGLDDRGVPKNLYAQRAKER